MRSSKLHTRTAARVSLSPPVLVLAGTHAASLRVSSCWPLLYLLFQPGSLRVQGAREKDRTVKPRNRVITIMKRGGRDGQTDWHGPTNPEREELAEIGRVRMPPAPFPPRERPGARAFRQQQQRSANSTEHRSVPFPSGLERARGAPHSPMHTCASRLFPSPVIKRRATAATNQDRNRQVPSLSTRLQEHARFSFQEARSSAAVAAPRAFFHARPGC